MHRLIRNSVLLLVPVFLIIIFLLFINILTTDWKYAHKSHSVYPGKFDWLSYKVDLSLKKIENNFLNEKTYGLPAVYLYISEKSQNKLLSNVPKSTKKWKKGFFLMNDGTLKKIKIRHRGDNPANWMFEKKSWRIKTKKRDMFDRVREIDYIAPQDFNFLNGYSGGKIANIMGLLSPKVKLVELFVNDKSSGIYIETEKLNENFLRRSGLMPVNLYKGEQYNTEAMIGIDDDLFNNPGLWTKVANFNQVAENDNSDLKDFFDLVRRAESNNDEFNKLLRRSKKWVDFSVYQILTQNYHNDFIHNMRIALDPWTGIVHPISHDADLGVGYNEIYPLEYSAHSLLALLNKSSSFIDDKYNTLLHYLTKNKVLSNYADHIDILGKAINVSSRRDLGKVQTLELKQRNDSEKNREEYLRSELLKKLKNHENDLIDNLFSKPIASWSYSNKKLYISINDEVPIGNISIKYNKGSSPKWIGIDENSNGLIDNNEKTFVLDGNNITIPVRLYANRISIADNTFDMNVLSNVNTINTKFSFITDGDFKPSKVSVLNPFSNKRYTLDFKLSNAVFPSRLNKPIYSELYNEDNDIRFFSGILKIEDTIVVEKESKILPGTVFKISNGSSIIFRNKVEADGTKEKPIVFEKISNNSSQWGTVAIVGPNTSKSIMRNVRLSGGSGGFYNGINYTSMLSLHNTSEILIDSVKLFDNNEYDDMVHIIYCSNISIKDSFLSNANSDAIDIDMSKGVSIDNVTIRNSGNDAIDFMETTALINSSNLSKSLDKAISAGENSNIRINNTHIFDNNFGIVSKDKSNVKVTHSIFDNNKVQLSAYSKNWRYGEGGVINVWSSNFTNKDNVLQSMDDSFISIDNSTIRGKFSQYGHIEIDKDTTKLIELNQH